MALKALTVGEGWAFTGLSWLFSGKGSVLFLMEARNFSALPFSSGVNICNREGGKFVATVVEFLLEFVQGVCSRYEVCKGYICYLKAHISFWDFPYLSPKILHTPLRCWIFSVLLLSQQMSGAIFWQDILPRKYGSSIAAIQCSQNPLSNALSLCLLSLWGSQDRGCWTLRFSTSIMQRYTYCWTLAC